MTPQERDVISGIFDRLKQAGDAPRDAETERFIADQVAKQPYAPYVMAQSIYVQEQALEGLQKQVEQLKQQLHEAELRPQQQSGGFLSGLFGGGASQAAAPRPSGLPPQSSQNYAPQQQNYAPQQQNPAWGSQAAAPSGPWGGQAAAQPGGGAGGFLKSAAMTAAGVAGGMVVGNMLMNAFSGGGHAQAAGLGNVNTSSFGDALNGNGSGQKYDDGYQDAQQDADFDRQQAQDDAYQDAQQDASFDDGDSDDDFA